MARLQRRRFTEPDDVRTIPHGRIDVVELDDRVVGRMTYDPGWRWSVDVKPVAGTESCQFHHIGVTLSGQLRVQMPDGIELEIGPGDLFEIPPGHDAWVIGDEPWISVDFEAMRAYGRAEPAAGRRVLTSILFTDIVGSTAQAVAQGPSRWRNLVSRHNEVTERILDEHDGRLVKTTGDGVVGLFDSAEQAVRAAAALSDALLPLAIRIRSGVHSGEVEISTGDVRGVAVHAAARIMALAEPNGVWVSATVRDLVDGTGLEFEDAGVHELKGLPGQRQLFRLVRPRAARARALAGGH
ncbi:MAG TPA: adenylate/guanylate cyclase domain-containing protein [Candidatus Limnocylindrales bacterium]|jgi:class 3 adenylate cyclase